MRFINEPEYYEEGVKVAKKAILKEKQGGKDMKILSRCKVILIYMVIFSLLFCRDVACYILIVSYCIVNDFTAYDIEFIDKIEKKESKDKKLFFEDRVEYVPLCVICKINTKFIRLKTSYLYQKLARPPPCYTLFDSVLKHTFLSTENQNVCKKNIKIWSINV